MLIVIEIIAGIRRIDLLIGILSVLSYNGAIVGCKDHVIEGIIEGSIQNPEAVGGRSFELGLLIRQGIEIG